MQHSVPRKPGKSTEILILEPAVRPIRAITPLLPVAVFRQGFHEFVKHGETIKLFSGTANPEEVESFLSQEVPHPEVSVSHYQQHMLIRSRGHHLFATIAWKLLSFLLRFPLVS